MPSLALGIPGDASSAVLIGSLLILGFFPGPTLFEQQTEIVGGIFLVYLAATIALLLVGILFRATNYPLAPVVIGIILGPLLENNLRRALLISREGYWIFLDRPVAASILAINLLLLAGAGWIAWRRRQAWKAAQAEA